MTVFSVPSGKPEIGIILDLGINASGTASATGTILASGFPEGSLAFSGAPFTSVILSTSAPEFGIGHLIVQTAAAVPEPGTLTILPSRLGGSCSDAAQETTSGLILQLSL
jgi:hypothetical protein